MHRKKLLVPFKTDRAYWTCPTCELGTLLVVKGSLKKDERQSSRDHSHTQWEPGWIEYVYSCLFRCSNSTCKETVSSTGIGTVNESGYLNDEESWVEVYRDVFTPKFFEPHLKLIRIPDSCPDAVRQALNDSFRLFFAAPSSAATHLRIAVDHIVDDLEKSCSDTTATDRPKRKSKRLHERIESLPESTAKAMLMAVKWHGNAGAHEVDPMDHLNLLDAFDLMQSALEEIYSDNKRLVALAGEVNEKKGPL